MPIWSADADTLVFFDIFWGELIFEFFLFIYIHLFKKG